MIIPSRQENQGFSFDFALDLGRQHWLSENEPRITRIGTGTEGSNEEALVDTDFLPDSHLPIRDLRVIRGSCSLEDRRAYFRTKSFILGSRKATVLAMLASCL